jgi:hypothetical protein
MVVSDGLALPVDRVIRTVRSSFMPKKPIKQTPSPVPRGARFPLSFDKAVEGLLSVKPDKRPEPKKKPPKR